MTPYQVGFLASRILAILCAVVAATYAASLNWIFQGVELVDRTADVAPISTAKVVIQYAFAALPFATSFTFAILLWFRAHAVSRALVPESQSQPSDPMTVDRVGRLAMRLLGLYFIVARTPQAVNLFIWLVLPNHGQDSPFFAMLFRSDNLSWIGDFVQLLLGILLFIGWDRIKQWPRAWQRWTSLSNSNGTSE